MFSSFYYLILEIFSKIDKIITITSNPNNKISEKFWIELAAKHREFVMKFNKRFGTSYNPGEFNIKWLEQKCEDIGIDTGRVIQSVGTLGGGNHFIELGKSLLTGDYWFTVHSGSRQFGLKICNYWQRKAGKGALAYLTGDDMFGYLSDMVVAQTYAELNRFHMVLHIMQ